MVSYKIEKMTRADYSPNAPGLDTMQMMENQPNVELDASATSLMCVVTEFDWFDAPL